MGPAAKADCLRCTCPLIALLNVTLGWALALGAGVKADCLGWAMQSSLCSLGYAIQAMQSRLCNLGYAVCASLGYANPSS
eukprot:1381752-Karenia_brevis.AAC.1